MSRAARLMCGLILIVVPTIEYGGYYIFKSLLNPALHYATANPLREDLERAGHAHAGVIILLSLIGQLLADHASLPPWLIWAARISFPASAILLSAGFFISARVPGAVPLVYAGAVLLALTVLTLGIGLLRAPRGSPAE